MQAPSDKHIFAPIILVRKWERDRQCEREREKRGGGGGGGVLLDTFAHSVMCKQKKNHLCVCLC